MLSSPWTQKRRLPVIAVLLLAILGVLAVYDHSTRRDYYLPAEIIPNTRHYAVDKSTSFDHADADFVCNSVGFRSYGKERKVYDLIMFSTELDWLEIRLNMMDPVVDFFIIIESPTTFTGGDKPLILRDNWDRFQQFWPKIIYREVHDPLTSMRTWDHEDYLRNSMLYAVFPSLSENEMPQKGDVLVVSDMDELIRPETMLLLRYCSFPRRLTLRSQFFYYSFQYRHRGEEWDHPQATIYGGSIANTIAPNDLRMGLLRPGLLNYPYQYFRRYWDRGELWNAGWHCSSCFSTIAEFQMKMNSFSHQGWNTENNRNPGIIAERVKGGLDLFGRPGQEFDRVEGNEDIPSYIEEQFRNHGRFRYMVNRDDEHAGFEDWDVQMSGG
ncbi:putative glycosyl transferase, family 17 [Septoria linicola]|nr:putative glycosyl transferase, family 17 [Septoria linicola]